MTQPKGMQPGDDRLTALGDALHKERTERHAEQADCWACAAVDSTVVQQLAVDSSTLAALVTAMRRYGAPDNLTPLSRFHWLLERQPSAHAIRAEWNRLDEADAAVPIRRPCGTHGCPDVEPSGAASQPEPTVGSVAGTDENAPTPESAS